MLRVNLCFLKVWHNRFYSILPPILICLNHSVLTVYWGILLNKSYKSIDLHYVLLEYLSKILIKTEVKNHTLFIFLLASYIYLLLKMIQSWAREMDRKVLGKIELGRAGVES